jgi:hypothetical protein
MLRYVNADGTHVAMRRLLLFLVLFLVFNTGLHFPRVFASAPSGTTNGTYALHLKTSAYTDDARVSGPIINRTIVSGSTFSFKVSIFIASGIGVPFEMRYLLFPFRSYANDISIWFYNSTASTPGNIITVYVGNAEFGGGTWNPGEWYNLEIRLTNNAGAFYVNGTQAGSFSNADVSGLTIENMYNLGTGVKGEIYVDGISMSQDSSIIYSEGFESGLSSLQVTRAGSGIVDTVYFGPPPSTSSTTLGAAVGNNYSYVNLADRLFPGYGVPLGSTLRITGTVQDASSLDGVSSAPISVEVSYDFGTSFEHCFCSTFQTLGSTTSDGHGSFAIDWKPKQMGVAAIRATYPGNGQFFGSVTIIYVDVFRAASQLSLSLSSSTNLLGYSVGINGTLLGIDSAPISNANILFEFTVPGASGWTTLTSTSSGTNGQYEATWLPQATGRFTVRATWTGNGTYRPSSDTANLTSISYESKYVFSVVSKATVSSVSFDSGIRSLTFEAQGPQSGRSYVDVALPKELLPDSSQLRVLVNGTAATFQTITTGEVVQVSIELIPHTLFMVQIQLPAPAQQTSPNNAIVPYLLYSGLAVVGALASLIVFRFKNKRVNSPK